MELGTTADELAFDRSWDEYVCAPLVELRFVPEWARTIARHWLYETADEARLAGLKESGDAEVAGLAAKIDREEAYHRIHAEMWIDRLLAGEARGRLEEAVRQLWPYALGVLDDDLRRAWVERVRAKLPFELPDTDPAERGAHSEQLQELWNEMTMVRRSQPAGVSW